MGLIDKEINVINNVRYLVDGYGFCALEKMIPTDVPIVCVYGQVTDSQMKFLKKVMEKCCLIGVGETAVSLLESDIKVDFITFSGNTKYEVFEENEIWQATPIIVNTEIPALIFEKHKGKAFFWSSGNVIEQFVFNKALEQGNAMYQYNRLIEIVPSGLREYLLFLAEFMGGSKVMLLEGKANNDDMIEVFEHSVFSDCVHISDNKLKQYFKVPVDTEKILSWLIPLFDVHSAENFVNGYNNLKYEFLKMKKIVSESMQLYEKLYELAIRDIVLKDELDIVINRLNENTAILEAMEHVLYLLDISETINLPREDKEKPNEIAEIATDAIDRYKKLMYVLEEIIAGFLEIKQENISKATSCSDESRAVKNILLVGGSSQYNVLPYFVEGLKEGFQRLGVTTYRYIFNREEYGKMKIEGYNHFQNTVGYEYVLLMNGVFLEWERYDGIYKCYRNMFDNKKTKIIPMFVDHPVHHMARMNYAHQAYAVLLADNNWVKYVNSYVKDIPRPVFLPLGGLEQEGKECVEFKKRVNKIVFFGWYSDISEQEERINCHKYAELIKRIIKILKNNPDMTIEAAVNRVEEENMSSYTTRYIVFNTDVFEIIDTYIRQFFRQKVVDTIIRAGLPIDIYGWKNAPYEEYENVVLKEAVSFDEMLEICRSVRFVLNVQPWLKSGTQERVFNTMLSGAVAITDETEYLREKTIDETNILLYKLEELEKLPAKIQYYMNREEEAEQIARNGFEMAEKYHTWSCRAKELMGVLGQEVE